MDDRSSYFSVFSNIISLSTDRLNLVPSYRYVLAIVALVYAVFCVPIMMGVLALIWIGFALLPSLIWGWDGIYPVATLPIAGLVISALSFGLTLHALKNRQVHFKLKANRSSVSRPLLLIASGSIWPVSLWTAMSLESRFLPALPVFLSIVPGLLASYMVVLAKTPR
jgi:hypothetical protein